MASVCLVGMKSYKGYESRVYLFEETESFDAFYFQRVLLYVRIMP